MALTPIDNPVPVKAKNLAIPGSVCERSSNTAILQAPIALARTDSSTSLDAKLGELPHSNPYLDNGMLLPSDAVWRDRTGLYNDELIQKIGDVSNTRLLVSNVAIVLSNVAIVLSNTRLLVSNIAIVLSNVAIVLSNTRLLVSNIAIVLSNTRLLVSNVAIVLSKIWIFLCAIAISLRCI